MKLNIAVLPGDGIGPEIMKEGVKVMKVVADKFGHEFSFNEAICGAHAIDAVGDPFPEETFKTCMDADAVLFAAVGDPRFDNDPTAKVRPEQGLLAMRKKLGLFANVRPVATFDCLLHKSPLKDELLKGADFVVIRELTGGMYFGEKYQDNDKAYDTDIYTRPEIERILKVAFEFAMKRTSPLSTRPTCLHRHVFGVRLPKRWSRSIQRLQPTICLSTMPQCVFSPSLASSMSSLPRTPLAISLPTRLLVLPVLWDCSRQARLASTLRSSSRFMVRGHRLPAITSPTP